MKKILLTTTAMGLFAASAALAEGPTVTVGGYADVQYGVADQENVYSNQGGGNTAYASDTHSRTDTFITFKVDGKTDAGLGYGAFIELNADTTRNDTSAADNNAERTYIYVESGFGRVEAGANGDAGNALRVDASTIASATGGIGGDFYKYVDISNSQDAAGGEYLVLPGLLSANGLPGEANGNANDTHSDRANANKISYYTPRIQGLQAGVSYTPDQQERGSATGFAAANTAGNAGQFENVWNLGVNYEGQYNDFGFAVSAVGEAGDAKEDATTPLTNFDDLRSYALGASVSFAGAKVAGSYGNAPEFGQNAAFGSELDYWTLGAAYEFGPFGTSITYMESVVENSTGTASATGTRSDKEFNSLSLGADYKLAPGLVPYVEVTFFETDDNKGATVDNEGTVFLVGTALTF